MRRRSSNPFDEQTDPELDMAPLIDVGFLLLIYFIVTSSLTKQEADLGLQLPGSATIQGRDVRIDQMMIHVSPESKVLINDEVVETDLNDRRLPNLTDRLRRYKASSELAGSEPMVIISCADEAKEQRFVDVLNACVATGIDNINLSR